MQISCKDHFIHKILISSLLQAKISRLFSLRTSCFMNNKNWLITLKKKWWRHKIQNVHSINKTHFSNSNSNKLRKLQILPNTKENSLKENDLNRQFAHPRTLLLPLKVVLKWFLSLYLLDFLHCATIFDHLLFLICNDQPFF